MWGVRALGDHPFRLGIDTGLFQQRGELHAGPLRTRSEAMQRLHIRLDRLRREERRAVAAALDESEARHHRIARERIEREDERPLYETMDRESMLLGIDLGIAGVRDGEVQAVRRHHPLQPVMRRARVLRARLRVRIAERAHHALLVLGGRAVGRHKRAGFVAPFRVSQRLRGGRLYRISSHCCGECRAAAQECATVEPAIACHRYVLVHAPSSSEDARKLYAGNSGTEPELESTYRWAGLNCGTNLLAPSRALESWVAGSSREG